jgi:hypothetical protein
MDVETLAPRTGERFWHLHPAVRYAAGLPDAERLALIRNATPWIEHTVAGENMRKILMAMGHPPSPSMPNYMLIAPSGNGKTTLLLKILDQFPPRQVGEVIMRDVVFANMTPVPSPTRFYISLMNAVGAPVRVGARVDELDRSVKQVYTDLGIRLLMVDEFHNMKSCPIHHQQCILNQVKDLGNELKILIVIAGTGDVHHAIKNDRQMVRRFELMELRPWYDADDILNLLVSFAQLFPLRHRSDLGKDRVADLVLKRTDGTIGNINRFLQTAAIEAIESGTERLTFELLSAVRFISPDEQQRRIRKVL